MTSFEVYDWFLEILQELQTHAYEDNCEKCEKLIENMANEVRELKGKKRREG